MLFESSGCRNVTFEVVWKGDVKAVEGLIHSELFESGGQA
jgi:hypothetical protein